MYKIVYTFKISAGTVTCTSSQSCLKPSIVQYKQYIGPTKDEFIVIYIYMLCCYSSSFFLIFYILRFFLFLSWKMLSLSC